MVDTGKWTEKDYDMFVKYQDQKDIMMNLSIDTTNELKKRAAMKSAEKKWGEIAPLLSKMSPDKVITFLKSDSEGYKKLLQYIVDNQLPPPGYASELLKKLENA
jgi:hypothetical protein